MKTPNGSDVFEKEYKVIGVFIENAKTYIQLSASALLLTVTFLREIVGIPKEQKLPRDSWLMLSWWSFLVAIVLGALYQYYAAKFLEWKSGVPRSHRIGQNGWFATHGRRMVECSSPSILGQSASPSRPSDGCKVFSSGALGKLVRSRHTRVGRSAR